MTAVQLVYMSYQAVAERLLNRHRPLLTRNALARLERLLDRVEICALTEVDECLKEKEPLVLMASLPDYLQWRRREWRVKVISRVTDDMLETLRGYGKG